MPSDASKPHDFSALSPLANELAQAIARVASDIVLVIDGNGVIQNVAEGASALPGDCAGWVGQRWVDTVSADTRRKIQLLMDETSATGVSQRREVNHPVSDGDAVPMAWTAIRLGLQGPVVAVGRDLRAVAAIQRSFLDAQHEMELDYWQRRNADNRYRTLFQVARDAVLVLDAGNLDLIESNDAARVLFDPAAQHVGSRSFLDRVPASARASLAELLAAARSSGRAGEIRVRLAAAGPSWDVSATPFMVADRLQLLVRGRAHDAAMDADTQPAMVRSLVESTPDAVVITDSSGHILHTNPAFLALVQAGSEAQVAGRNLALVVGDRAGAWQATIERTRVHGLCPCTPLNVMHGELGIAVEVSSALLAEGEQEHLGFTLRTVEPPRPDSVYAVRQAWPELDALRAQVGSVPLQTLLREGGEVLERQIILTALRQAKGDLATAARLLSMEPERLQRRMRTLDRLVDDVDALDDEGPAPAAPPRMN